jgi:methionine-S-sulfoxide reductase
MIKTALFAGGSFWGMEAALQAVPGVIETEVGYAGGSTDDPTYRQVCSEESGHAETVKVTYDTVLISYEKLLDAFFAVHDHTTADPNGCEFGTQYRSIVFYNDDEERKTARQLISKLTRTLKYGCAICTELQPIMPFYPAEAYHQDYYRNHGLWVSRD